MDEADLAQRHIELEEEMRRLAAEKRNKEPALKPIGECYYCTESLAKPKLFCNNDCAEDYEYEESRRKANGG